MSKTSIFLLIAIITGFASFSRAGTVVSVDTGIPDSCSSISSDSICQQHPFQQPVSSLHTPPDASRKKKLVSALFAFPFPCGFMGTHRVMLGTSPWVPVVYVATFGGCFGLLPLIDFCFITFSKDITPFENNPHVFMWVK